MSDVQIWISIGEWYDRVSILTIKSERIKNKEKLDAVKEELKMFRWSYDPPIDEGLFAQIKEVNNLLWDIENKIRAKEAKKEFDDSFITLARMVYAYNDKRNSIKAAINKKFGSAVVEVKEYTTYTLGRSDE